MYDLFLCALAVVVVAVRLVDACFDPLHGWAVPIK